MLDRHLIRMAYLSILAEIVTQNNIRSSMVQNFGTTRLIPHSQFLKIFFNLNSCILYILFLQEKFYGSTGN